MDFDYTVYMSELFLDLELKYQTLPSDIRPLNCNFWPCQVSYVQCQVIYNLFIYQARESSLVPEGFLTAQFLQKL